jgi:U4/U6.U5 tri-snRNP component SNU23
MVLILILALSSIYIPHELKIKKKYFLSRKMDMSNVPKPSPPVKETLKARKESPLAPFSGKIGKVQIIEKEIQNNGVKSSSTSSQGFHCSTCNATFTSSDAFLDHCNGKVHQKNLGVTLKVERVDEVDRVKARLKQLTQKRLAAEMVIQSNSATNHFDKILEKAQDETQNLKEERKARKQQKKQLGNDLEESEEEQENGDLMALMGFKSFS